MKKHGRSLRNNIEMGESWNKEKSREWFDSVKNTEYTLVGQVYNESVYVKNDGRKINYTSFVSGENMSYRISMRFMIIFINQM